MLKDNDNLEKIMQHVNAGKHHTKVGIDCLVVEITRKCNMQPVCKHCMRGLPQNVSLNNSAIDNLLSQVAEIGEISVTGGEPLLCLDSVRYLFEKLKQNNIVLDAFLIITNGLIFSQEFESLIREIDGYICEVSPNAPNPHITIGVSIDQYHNNNRGKTFIEKCNGAFSTYSVSIEPQIFGGNPTRMGLAKSLPEWKTVKHFPSHMEQSAIAIWEPFSGTDCPSFNLDSMKGKQHIPYILCPIYLSATGKLYIAALAGRIDYRTTDKSEAICNMNDDPYLLDSVRMYNRNKPSCISALFRDNLLIANKIDDPSVVSVKDEQDAEVNELLNLICKVLARYSEYSATDRQIANADMQMIFEVQREYPEDKISLNIAISIWLERLKETGGILHYISGDSRYTNERAEIINALLDIDNRADD